MKKSLSKNNKIWLTIGSVAAIVAVIVAVTVAVLFLTGNGGSYCPRGSHKRCAPLGDGEERCHCERDGSKPTIDKPIIYLYPEEVTSVNVQLGYPDKLIASYPAYGAGWSVTAHPCGKLVDNTSGRELYGLYWEGKGVALEIGDSGFVVKREDVPEFLEEKLTILGLNDREAEEFIVYWLPKLQANEYNLIRFADRNEIDEYMPLAVTPRPDSVIRILMLTKAIDAPIEISEQDLGETPVRDGFTVVEWGGSEI